MKPVGWGQERIVFLDFLYPSGSTLPSESRAHAKRDMVGAFVWVWKIRKLTQGNERHRAGEAWCYSTSHGRYCREQEGRMSHRQSPQELACHASFFSFLVLNTRKGTLGGLRENEPQGKMKRSKRARQWRMWKMKECRWEHFVLFQEKVIEMSGMALSLPLFLIQTSK